MRIRDLFPPAAAIVALALGLTTIAAPSPARAQDDRSGRDAGPRVEKKIIRITDDQDQESGGDAGYLGVQVQELTSALRRAKNIPGSIEGALVASVEDDGPAADAGIRVGDVVLEVDQRPTSDPSELIDVVGGLEPGASVKVVLYRAGSRKTVFVTVGSRPNDVFETRPPTGSLPGDRDPAAMRSQLESMRGQRAEIQRQLEEIRDQIAQLRREIRALRSELRNR